MKKIEVLMACAMVGLAMIACTSDRSLKVASNASAYVTNGSSPFKQVSVTIGISGINAVHRDDDLRTRLSRTLFVELDLPLDLCERTPNFRHHGVARHEADTSVARVDDVVASEIGNRLGGCLGHIYLLVVLTRRTAGAAVS